MKGGVTLGNKKTRVLLNHLHLAYINADLLNNFKKSENVDNFLGWIKAQTKEFFRIELTDKQSIEAVNEAARYQGYEDISEWIQARMRRQMEQKNGFVKRKRSNILERLVDANERKQAAHAQRVFTWMRLGWELSAITAMLSRLLKCGQYLPMLNPRIHNRTEKMVDYANTLRKKLSEAPGLAMENGKENVFFNELSQAALAKAEVFIDDVREAGLDYAKVRFRNNERQQIWEQMSWEIEVTTNFVRSLTYDSSFAEILPKRTLDDFYYLLAQVEGLTRVLDSKFSCDDSEIYEYVFFCYPKDKEKLIKGMTEDFRNGLSEKLRPKVLATYALFSPALPDVPFFCEHRDVIHAHASLSAKISAMLSFFARTPDEKPYAYMSKQTCRKWVALTESISDFKHRAQKAYATEREDDIPVFTEPEIEALFNEGAMFDAEYRKTGLFFKALMKDAEEFCVTNHGINTRVIAWTKFSWLLAATKQMAKSIAGSSEAQAILGEELIMELEDIQSSINDAIASSNKNFLASPAHLEGVNDSPFFCDLELPRQKADAHLMAISSMATKWSDKYFDLLAFTTPSDEELDAQREIPDENGSC